MRVQASHGQEYVVLIKRMESIVRNQFERSGVGALDKTICCNVHKCVLCRMNHGV